MVPGSCLVPMKVGGSWFFFGSCESSFLFFLLFLYSYVCLTVLVPLFCVFSSPFSSGDFSPSSPLQSVLTLSLHPLPHHLFFVFVSFDLDLRIVLLSFFIQSPLLLSFFTFFLYLSFLVFVLLSRLCPLS